jgi:hypothetical protein
MALSVIPTSEDISRTLMSGVFAIANNTWEWFVRKVHVVFWSVMVCLVK